MRDYSKKKIVFYTLINGVGSSTMAYQVARLLRLPLYQEQENDLVYFLKHKLETSRYGVKQLNEADAENYEVGGVYDLKTANKKIFMLATDIIVLTNNSHIDVLKTIATLQKIQSQIHDSHKPVHVIFNRLQNGNVEREKKYTDVSKELILSNIKNMNIKFSYIRNNLIYYREVSEGRFFMDSFFNKDEELLKKYPEIREMEHTDHLEMFYDYQYEDTPYDFKMFETSYERLYEDRVTSALEYNETLKNSAKRRKTTPDAINTEIAKLNLNGENIKNSRASIRDMYSLLYKMGIYDKAMYECYLCKKDVPCWKRTIREERKRKKLTGEASKCRQFRTRIEES